MRHNHVRITDKRNQTFNMEIWTPSTATNLKFWNCDRTRYQVADWETSDKGFIRFSSGDAFLASRKSPVIPGYCFSGSGFGIFNDLYIGESGAIDGNDYEVFNWGMVLYDYVDRGGAAHDKGDGVVKQSWVLALEPGTISWELFEKWW